MSVGRADANGSGSVSPPVPASTTDSAASGKGMPKAGLADGANTTWSTARKPVQVAEVSKRAASLDFKAIDVALDDLTLAELRFVGAYNSYVKEKNDENRAAYQKEKDRYRTAQIDFEMIIEKQTNRLAGDSSVDPGHGLKNCAKVRLLEKKMLDHAAGPQRDHLAGAISENRGLRAPRELRALSAKMQEGNLNPAQKSEAAHIVGDATDAVTGKHWDEAGLSPDLVTIGRLDRLDQLLEAATKSSDGVTRNAQKLDLGLYDQVTANIRAQMGSLDAASNKEFDDIVAKYRARLTPEINLGP